MHQSQSPLIDIFCRVIDNFGDAGVMWRLARAMRAKSYRVRLIIDDPQTLTFLAGVSQNSPTEKIGIDEGIEVVRWEKSWDSGYCPLESADVVIEGFACRLPPGYEELMRKSRPKWFNIDYFSAESWIENCHLVPSIDPTSGLVNINYFPGVTARSGGLVIEKDYEETKASFTLSHPAKSSGLRIFFFAYPYGPIKELATAIKALNTPIELNLSQCEASHLLSKSDTIKSAPWVRVKNLPFTAQKDFDQLLWNSDIAFVRGEDSAARAMIAGVPFIWHIYHQDDDVHMVKLKALQNRLKPYFEDESVFDMWCSVQESYNKGDFDQELFKALVKALTQWNKAVKSFGSDLRSLGSLSDKLSDLIKNG